VELSSSRHGGDHLCERLINMTQLAVKAATQYSQSFLRVGSGDSMGTKVSENQRDNWRIA
jgi:hypothetical protein